ncbi:riboflavin synthase subunit beta [Formosa sp. PL04]|uniref:riboflavin synthase subunit beta n=1 Tax=Formosa sp. PL04 TaxID=3081755 RepID=UPI0029828750|nr:riboflavin synthase subunit beta [Formosa sp. PL04]MDW5290656.1 riboflavin synthase subunit beta [Formosa sp. PL04]
MGIFKTRTNKKFTYTSRHFKNDGEGSPYEMKHKFDEYRKTVGPSGGIKSKFQNAFEELKETPDRSANRRIIIIIAILILVFLFIIEFDLSIFLPNK